jgi:SAM-dependent methyltransferase
MAEERAKLRTTFDEVALLYDEVRPGYPEELFEEVVSLSGIPSDGRILEIGCGTGQASVPLAGRGYRVLYVEVGRTWPRSPAATSKRTPGRKCTWDLSKSGAGKKRPSSWPYRPPPFTGSTPRSPTLRSRARSKA